MGKKIIVCFFLLILISGCSVVRINTSSIDNITSVILSKDNTLYNQIGQGYKYYLPGGVSYIESDDLNDILYSNGVYYYLYVDAINYYYKTPINYKENNKKYYSKHISTHDGYKYDGYLEITQIDGVYQVDFVYNYAKIEVETSLKNLNDVVLNCSYILSTIKYNPNIISLMLKEDYFTNKTGKYDIYGTKSDSSEFKLQKESEIVKE